jgi:pimeloyl-ACP methyl ester carboxylesterase
MIEMKRTFIYRNKSISCSVAGSGETIFLLHGYLESSEVWSNFALKLSENHRVVAVDLPGHGDSDLFGEIHTMEFIAETIRFLLKELGLQKAFIAGHSLGGYVALALVDLFPEIVKGYCLFHSHPFPDSEEAIARRMREINLVRKGKKDLMYPDNVSAMYATSNLERFTDAIERSKRIASAIPGEGIIAVLRGMIARPSRLKLMEEGRVPCLWILGSWDNYINCDQVRVKVRLPHNAEVVVLNNSGHMGFIEEEELAVKLLTEFVRQNTN